MAATTRSQKQRALAKPKLRVSQIVVNLVLVNEHDAPVQPDQLVFTGNENGTAAENLIAWMNNLPAHLAKAGTPEPATEPATP